MRHKQKKTLCFLFRGIVPEALNTFWRHSHRRRFAATGQCSVLGQRLWFGGAAPWRARERSGRTAGKRRRCPAAGGAAGPCGRMTTAAKCPSRSGSITRRRRGAACTVRSGGWPLVPRQLLLANSARDPLHGTFCVTSSLFFSGSKWRKKILRST